MYECSSYLQWNIGSGSASVPTALSALLLVPLLVLLLVGAGSTCVNGKL